MKIPFIFFAKFYLDFAFSVANSTFAEVYWFKSELWRICKSTKTGSAEKTSLKFGVLESLVFCKKIWQVDVGINLMDDLESLRVLPMLFISKILFGLRSIR